MKEKKEEHENGKRKENGKNITYKTNKNFMIYKYKKI